MKRLLLVHYISPFGSPAWMTAERAQELLVEDDDRWLQYQAAGNLSEAQRLIGPPRIERAS